ncbi:MAG: hypothetical protein P8188_04860 [Gemmatimonadota bacterium]
MTDFRSPEARSRFHERYQDWASKPSTSKGQETVDDVPGSRPTIHREIERASRPKHPADLRHDRIHVLAVVDAVLHDGEVEGVVSHRKRLADSLEIRHSRRTITHKLAARGEEILERIDTDPGPSRKEPRHAQGPRADLDDLGIAVGQVRSTEIVEPVREGDSAPAVEAHLAGIPGGPVGGDLVPVAHLVRLGVTPADVLGHDRRRGELPTPEDGRRRPRLGIAGNSRKR